MNAVAASCHHPATGCQLSTDNPRMAATQQQGEPGAHTMPERAAAPAEPAEDVDEPSTSAAVPEPTCDVCQAATHKYKCPGCTTRTCSLACSKQHKADSGCSGQRNKLAYVPLKEFSDRELLSDYGWLEEVKRADDNAHRLRPPGGKRELPPHLATLVQQARQRGVRLMIMAPGMQRRKDNTSRYDFRLRSMVWRVDWAFPSAAGTPHVADARVDEDKALLPLLTSHLTYKPGVGAKHFALRAYADAGADKLRLFLRKEGCPANAQRYFPIDPTQSLRSQLSGKTLVEYPRLIVALPGEEGSYPAPTPEEEEQERQERERQQLLMRPQPPPPARPPPAPQQQEQSGEQPQQPQSQQEGQEAQTQQQRQQGGAGSSEMPALNSEEQPAKRARTDEGASAVSQAGTFQAEASAAGALHFQQRQQGLPPPPSLTGPPPQQQQQQQQQQKASQPPPPQQQQQQQQRVGPVAAAPLPAPAQVGGLMDADDGDLLAGLDD